MFPGSGTGGWEAAISNTLSTGDRVLTSSFGQFSSLWVAMCREFGLDVVNCDVTWGEGVPLDQYREKLEADKSHMQSKLFWSVTTKPRPALPVMLAVFAHS